MRRTLSRRALAGVCLGAAIAIGLAIGLIARGRFDGRYAVPVAGAVEPAVPPRAAAPVQTRMPPATIRPAPAAPPALDTDVPVDEDDGERIAGAVARATLKALRRGEAVRWHKAGREGYVTVSEPQDYADRTCRNVTATIASDDGQAMSNVHLWCVTDDDEWAPAS